MKKLIAITLVVVLAFSLAACENNSKPSGGNSTSTPPTSSGGGNSTPSSTPDSTPDTSTVAGFLSQFDLAEADIKPDGAPDGTHTVDVSKETKGRVSWNVNDSTAENENKWIQKVIDKTKALATDGKLYVDSYFSSEFTFSSLEDADTSTITWVYKYDETYLIITCEILYGGVFDFNINQG